MRKSFAGALAVATRRAVGGGILKVLESGTASLEVRVGVTAENTICLMDEEGRDPGGGKNEKGGRGGGGEEGSMLTEQLTDKIR